MKSPLRSDLVGRLFLDFFRFLFILCCFIDVQNWDSQFLEGLELDLHNDPLENWVMNGKFEGQSLKASASEQIADFNEYHLNSSIIMSPTSTAPSSPSTLNEEYQTQISDETFTCADLVNECSEDSFNSELNDTSAMEIFDDILASMASVLESQDSSNFSLENQEVEVTSISKKSIHGRPKRSTKRPRDSVDSEESFEDPVWEPEVKQPRRKQRRGAMPPEVKKERKKNQNKNAANRYRLKKRAEQEAVESAEDEQIRIKRELQKQLEKIEMEFKVLIPLAQAAFRNDPARSLQVLQVQTNIAKLDLE